jgi:hypothetical protein
VLKTTDPDICVDRSIRPTYPRFAKREWINSPEFIALEERGPAQYDVRTLRPLRCGWQQSDNGEVGEIIYLYLRSNGFLERCIGLHDLEAIQQKGINFYRKYFPGQEIFAWKSMVEEGHGCILVPYLYEKGSSIVLRFRSVGLKWHKNHPALLFKV